MTSVKNVPDIERKPIARIHAGEVKKVLYHVRADSVDAECLSIRFSLRTSDSDFSNLNNVLDRFAQSVR